MWKKKPLIYGSKGRLPERNRNLTFRQNFGIIYIERKTEIVLEVSIMISVTVLILSFLVVGLVTATIALDVRLMRLETKLEVWKEETRK